VEHHSLCQNISFTCTFSIPEHGHYLSRNFCSWILVCSFGSMTGTCLIHIHALVSLYQIHTDNCTHISLNHHPINAIQSGREVTVHPDNMNLRLNLS
jgi:hypothetical protein